LGEVSIDLAVHNEKTGRQVWARSYRGSGSAQEPQVALAAAFRALALFIAADNSILDLRDIFFASGDKKPPQGVTSGKAPPHDEIASLPAKPAIEKKTLDARPNKIPPTITIISPEVKRGVNLLSRQNSVTIIGRATAANGMAQVTVNGDAVTLDDQGNFSTDILLKPGENRFVVMAADVLNNQKTERFTIVRRGEKIPRPVDEQAFVSSPGKMRYFALIIGINNYRNLDRLKTAVNDARTVAQVLKDDYGFETALLLNEQATRDGIMKELNMLRKKLTSRDKLLIYYAGHGDYNKETDTAYWMPVNAERDDNTNWIESKSISDQLKLISARHILVVSDSCYSGTLTRSAVTNLSGNDTRDIYLRKLEEKTSRILISSGGNEPVSDSGGKTHSIFADVFIKALKKAEKDIFTAEELHTLYIKESVAGRTAQTPEYKVIRNSGHDGGDFIFVKRK
jgi:hypothetical protein